MLGSTDRQYWHGSIELLCHNDRRYWHGSIELLCHNDRRYWHGSIELLCHNDRRYWHGSIELLCHNDTRYWHGSIELLCDNDRQYWHGSIELLCHNDTLMWAGEEWEELFVWCCNEKGREWQLVFPISQTHLGIPFGWALNTNNLLPMNDSSSMGALALKEDVCAPLLQDVSFSVSLFISVPCLSLCFDTCKTV